MSSSAPIIIESESNMVADGYHAFPRPSQDDLISPEIQAIITEIEAFEERINENAYQRGVSAARLAYVEKMKNVECDRHCYLQVQDHFPELLYLNLPRPDIRKSLEIAENALKNNMLIYATEMVRCRMQINWLENQLADEALKIMSFDIREVNTLENAACRMRYEGADSVLVVAGSFEGRIEDWI